MQEKKEILKDILDFYFLEIIANYPPSARKKIYGGSFSERLINSLKYLGRSVKEFFNPTSPSETDALKGKCWLYLIGDNNFNSLHFLENKVGETAYVSSFRYSKKGASIIQLKHPSRLRYLMAGLPVFFKLFFSGRVEVNRAWDVVFKSSGLYEYSIAMLKQYQPKAIIFANDTTLEPRALLHATRALNIPSFFIQHACTSDEALPLKYTCSFLEGNDSLDKYQLKNPIEGDVKLIGIPKMDPYLSKKNISKTVKRIAICSNLIDPVSAIEPLVNQILDAFPECTITYRAHPSDFRECNFNSNRLNISSSREEKSFDFLLNQDLIVAGNTSIHYEAAILNVVSIYYKFDTKGGTDDLYGFVGKGLVEKAETIEDLLSMIKNNIVQKKDMGEKARYYNAVLGTPNEGKSQALVIEHINQYLNRSNKRVEAGNV